MAPAAHPWTVAIAALQLGNRLIDAIQAAIQAQGFAEVRPIHGFAFTCLAAGDATAGQLAAYLGVTKQAAAQLVDRLVRDGFAARVAHPDDRRARLISLTPRALAVMATAQAAAEAEVSAWRARLPAEVGGAFEQGLLTLTEDRDTVRPTW